MGALIRRHLAAAADGRVTREALRAAVAELEGDWSYRAGKGKGSARTAVLGRTLRRMAARGQIAYDGQHVWAVGQLAVCIRKRQYRTAQAVRDVLRDIDIPVWAYKCPACWRWHLTSQPLRKAGAA